MNTFTIGVSLAVMLVGLIGYLLCLTVTKASVAELCRGAFWVGLFFVVWSVAGHLLRLS